MVAYQNISTLYTKKLSQIKILIFGHVAHKNLRQFWHIKKLIEIPLRIQRHFSKIFFFENFQNFTLFWKFSKKKVKFYQTRYNFEKNAYIRFFLKVLEKAQILIWKFRFTFALKLQRNFKNSKSTIFHI